MSQLFSSKIRMAQWIGIFIRTFEKFLICAFVRDEKFFHLFHVIEKFFSMLVKLCNVFYRPRPLFMATDPFLFTLCIKLTQHKHLPYQWIIKSESQSKSKSAYHRQQKNLLKMFKAIILCCVLCGMRYGMVWKVQAPSIVWVCVCARCVTQRQRGNNVSLSVTRATSTVTMYYNIPHVDIYVCFRRAFGWNSE